MIDAIIHESEVPPLDCIAALTPHAVLHDNRPRSLGGAGFGPRPVFQGKTDGMSRTSIMQRGAVRLLAMAELRSGNPPDPDGNDSAAGGVELSQEDPRTGQPERGIRLTEVVRFLRRNWALIALPALAAALLTVAVVLLLVPPSYEASAVLLITEPRFTSELKPPILSVQAYQNLLESDAVIAETKRRLVEEKKWRQNDPLRREHEIETKIFVSRRAEETSLAPMIQLVATGRTPEQAAAIANTWAEVFLGRVRRLTGDSTTESVEFIDGQYPQALRLLAGLEEKLNAQSDSSQQRYDLAADRWDRKVSAFNRETMDLLAGYRSETRRLLETYMSQKALETRRLQLSTMRKAFSDVQAELSRVNLESEQKKLLLAAARQQFKDIPEFITLQKAMSDEAMWQEMAKSQGDSPDWQKLRDRTLLTQTVNPVYTDLSSQVLQLEMEVNALVPRKSQLEQELAAMEEDIRNRDAGIRADDAALEKLQQERDAGLAKLQEERNLQVALFNRDRQQELDALKRTGQIELAAIDRTISQQKSLFDELLRKYNQAQLAKAQKESEDVRLGAPAVAPDNAKPRGTGVLALLAALLGGLAGLLAAAVREAGTAEKPVETP
jgi:uncharacterized protein involved in exopolysaccharide biosynthesis